MDSLLVMKVIEERKIKKVECSALIIDIQRLIEEHEIMQVVQVYKETNMCADILENIGCSKKQLWVYGEALYFLKPLLDTDRVGLDTSWEMICSLLSLLGLGHVFYQKRKKEKLLKNLEINDLDRSMVLDRTLWLKLIYVIDST